MLRFPQPLGALAVWLVFCALAIYTATAANCVVELTEQAGAILSPGFPESYPNNARCHWTITVAENQIIDLRFQRLDLERQSSTSCRDYVRIYDGPSTASPTISRALCGYRSEAEVTSLHFRSTGHQLHLFFYSDNSETRVGFSASYWAHECPPFMYGQDACDRSCNYCDQQNSLYCVNTNGTCVCKDGWTSSNCSVDVNECKDPNICSDLYSECHNTVGSFECACRPGLVKNATGGCEDPQTCTAKTCSHACGVTSPNPLTEECYCPKGMHLDHSDNLTCVACDEWMFGMNCASQCSCQQSRTQSCNKQNGLCTCYLNWTSTDCGEDVDECRLENPPCDTTHSTCYDTYGSFDCRCHQGYEKVTNETTCEECGRVLTEQVGVIKSPYDSGYRRTPDFPVCNWIIKTDESKVISLRFQSFQLYYNSDTKSGHVEIYNGRNSSSELIGNYSGNNRNLPPQGIVRSSGNEMYIVRYSAVYYSSNNFAYHRRTYGFDANYWTHECQDFMYGDNCTIPCACETDKTEYCNSTNGICICKEGWTSDTCSKDIDECYENPLQCPDYSVCKNLNGSVECICKAGLTLDSSGNCVVANGSGGGCSQRACSHVCVEIIPEGQTSPVEQCYCPIGMELDGDNCVACRNMTYGPDCYRDCACVPENTDICDARTGNCTCEQGWAEDDCSQDVNECQLETRVCKPFSNCSNTQGSFTCTCSKADGYEESNNGSCVKIDCSHTFRNASGTVSSPNYPASYFNNAFCTWDITVKEGNVVSLRFSPSFYIQYDSKCRYDYLEVYDGINTSSRLIGRYCYIGVPEIIRTTGNSMYIVFRSDWRYSYQGFTGTYTSHPCEVDTYGDDSCNNTCTCVKENTQLCDNVNGQCICKKGWRSDDCSVDVNECLGVNDCPDDSDCVNSQGGYKCQCHPGFFFNVSTSLCDAKSECITRKCSHACYISKLGEEKCACPDDLALDEDGGFCYVPYYTYGSSAQDQQLVSPVSGPIYFSSSALFGNTGESAAFVMSNGVIGFGGQTIRLAGSVDLVYAYDRQLKIVAPFWAQINPFAGRVFYHLYEECGYSTFSDDVVFEGPQPKKEEVMKRAEKDVTEFYDLPGFEVNTILLVTWESIQPFVSFSLIPEENTFQAIYISGWTKETRHGVEILSDEQTAYVIFIYQHGLMNWNFVPGRPISIGNTAYSVQTLNDLDTTLVTMLDRILGNTGYTGVVSYQVGSAGGPEQKCHKYLCSHADLLSDPIYKSEMRGLYKCPCTLERLGRQWRLYEKRGANRDIYCYAISSVAKRRLLTDNRRNKLCCYRWKKPDNDVWQDWLQTWREASYLPASPESGHVLINDPWSLFYFDNYQALENMRAHQWCCKYSEKAKYCERFYKIFPDMGCSNYVTFVPASALGDPHFTTLDGVKYTMNGLGEYIMLDIPGANFTLQTRTGRAETSNGSLTNATVFIGFAAKESDYASFQVELAFTKTSMVIYANGADVTNDFNNDVDYSLQSSDMEVQREYSNNKTFVVAVFPCGVSIKVHVAIKSLEIEFEVDKDLQGITRGLLGNFNNRTDDEFILPNGTQLSSDLSERDIYEQFAKKWEVTSANSVFRYESGEGTGDYQHPDFVPFFRDEADPDDLAQAIQLCGDKNDACIFDYLVTQDEQFADNTKQSQEEKDTITTNLDNNPPSIMVRNNSLNSNNRVMVRYGTETIVEVIAQDEDGDTVTYELIGDANGASVNDRGQVTLTADMKRPVPLGVRAKDSKGGYSSIEYIPITVCPNCSGHGQCDDNATRTIENDDVRFQILVCNCYPAYTGDDCESELDSCLSQPCSKGQECTDLTASQQGDSPVGYECGPCPQGFQDINGTCGDINECSNTDLCQQQCTNTEGSYTCSCKGGYRLDMTDKKSCVDINECEERVSNCQQLCVNTDGNYTCDCRDNYNLQADGKTCTLDPANETACQACQQVCTSTGCGCNIGYQIDPADNTSCLDIDECKEGNSPCNQACRNTEGKFECSCYNGYQLDEDGVSCLACERPYYGKDCAGICQCNGRGTCDPVRGCICNDHWSGTNCDVDVNECDQPNTCSSEFVCRNEMGSYSCVCPDGYYIEDGLCTDVNECTDPQTNTTCDFNLEICVNNIGSYSCECKQGYARNAGGSCEDVDECEGNSDDCEQICENLPGGYNCKCHRGYKLAEDRYSCRKVKDLCEGQGLNCSFGCTLDDNNTALCVCPRGYKLSGNGVCEDINECDLDETNLCANKTGCVNTNGSFDCSCVPGTKLDNDGRSCVACSGETWGIGCANSCACGSGTDYCDPVLGCVCRDGFTGIHCSVDIDECERGEDNCQVNDGEKCVNIPGSFMCACQSGMTGNFSGSCKDFNPCNDTRLNNCDQVCTNHQGSFTCSCYTGYIYNETTNTCIDTNECLVGNVQCQETCINTGGSYRCSCREGLKLGPDGFSCEAIEHCPKKETCSHGCALIGQTETCLCPRGFKLSSDGQTCEDVDLCNSSPCTDGCMEIKANTSFECLCKAGQILASDGISCSDCIKGKWGINCANDCSCLTFNTQSCNQATGTCTCKEGWEGDKCHLDINECEKDTNICPANSHCLNLNGSFSCLCDDGFVKKNLTSGICEECDDNFYGPLCARRCSCGPNFDCNKVNGSCSCSKGWKGSNCDVDVNECREGTDDCKADKFEMCQNIDGGYQCVCSMGYYRTDETADCQECDLWNYGHGCSQSCECNTTTTDYCNKTEGTCVCKDGWTGSDCGADVDECKESMQLCPDHSACKNVPGSHECTCEMGYTMNETTKTCNDVDNCNPNPCQNGATCVDAVNDYSCTCMNGYSDKNCSTDIDDCTPDPCKNGATCVDKVNDYSCTCVAGYSDKNCSTDINECDPDPCKNGASCVDSINDYSCTCSDGFMDKNCSTNIDDCTPDPCKNGATCVDAVNDYSCTCMDGYSDKNCSTDINECEAGHCKNGATCVDKINDYSCTCTPGYTGKDCSTDIDECKDEPCAQICTNSHGGFECSCRVGYMISSEDLTKCQAISLVRVTIIFNLDVSSIDLDNHNSDSYKETAAQAVILIKTRLTTAGIDVVSVVVVALRRGSLEVDYDVIVNKKEDSNPEQEITMTVVEWMKDGGGNTNSSVLSSVLSDSTGINNVAIGEKQFSTNDSVCQIKQKSDPCSNGCEEKDGVAVCKPEKKELNLNLILGLGLGIPLFLILCFVVGILAYWWTRKQRKSALSGSKESVSDRVSKDESDHKAGMASPFNFESKYQGKDRQIPQWRKGPVSGPFYNEAFPSYMTDYDAVGDYPSYAGSRGTSGTGKVDTGEPRPDYA